MNPTTFLEGTVGGGSNRVGSIPVSPFSDRRNPATGFSNFPFIFNQDGVPMDPGYNRDVRQTSAPPGSMRPRTRCISRPSSASAVWSRTPPPVIQYPEFLTASYTKELSVSLTKVAGRHNYKSGFYFFHSRKPQHRGGPQRGSGDNDRRSDGLRRAREHGAGREQSSGYRVRLRQCAAWRLLHLQPAIQVGGGQFRL